MDLQWIKINDDVQVVTGTVNSSAVVVMIVVLKFTVITIIQVQF